MARPPETPPLTQVSPWRVPLARKARKVHRLRVRQSLLGRMRLQRKPIESDSSQQPFQGSEGTRGGSHHCPCPRAKGNQPNTQTDTQGKPGESLPPFQEESQALPKVLSFLTGTSPLNYFNGQNKTDIFTAVHF